MRNCYLLYSAARNRRHYFCRKFFFSAGKKFVFAIVLLFISALISAQDIHFSQFNQAPTNLNPGLTGQFKGLYRIIANQRTQWRSVTIPYSTFGLSADTPRALGPNFGAGLSVFLDKAGDSRLSTTVVNISIAKSIDIREDKSAQLVPGIMIGITSMKIDYSKLNYDNQWNGITYDPSIDPDEKFSRNSRAYLNLNLGASYIQRWKNNRELIAGASLYNLSAPKQSFFNDGYVRLDPRLNLHGLYRFELNKDWQMAPSILFISQGKYKEVDIGGQAYYVFQKESWMYRAAYFGAYGRAGDAGFLVAGMKYDNWDVGLSYDINTSNLRPASNAKGGFEISVIYIVPPLPEAGKLRKICQDYI
ncbi:MAG: PorP/SprF family type IX secretion system membrane protein [Crocinitomicaceae bacterium]|nr:PorP/SprF family type IX secretion system membrane protein [Crocinitomicaceae bacterium]